MKQEFITKIAAVAMICALMIAASLTLTATPQSASRKATDKASSSRGTGPDNNIKETKDQASKNDPAQSSPAPPRKGGPKTRGLFDCWVTADNYTPWWIDVYVDGRYRGEVSPWGAGTVNAGAGSTMVYGRADFTDGSYKTWGPRQFECSSDGEFTWTLTQ